MHLPRCPQHFPRVLNHPVRWNSVLMFQHFYHRHPNTPRTPPRILFRPSFHPRTRVVHAHRGRGGKAGTEVLQRDLGAQRQPQPGESGAPIATVRPPNHLPTTTSRTCAPRESKIGTIRIRTNNRGDTYVAARATAVPQLVERSRAARQPCRVGALRAGAEQDLDGL